VNKQKAEGDTLKSGKRKGFHIQDILLGNNYKLADKTYLTYYSPLMSLNFNTVEGYEFNTRLRFRRSFGKNHRLEISPTMCYSFSRDRITGKAYVRWAFNRSKVNNGTLTLSGGRFVRQFNDQDPIDPIVNTLTSLFGKNNYMKIYEAKYLKLINETKITGNFGYSLGIEWNKRFRLQNNSNISYTKKEQVYTSNDPVNSEVTNTAFPNHEALVGSLVLHYQPWLKYRIRFDRKRPIKSSSPTFNLTYRKGIPGKLSDVDFDLIEVGVNHNFRLGHRGKLGFDMSAGKFLNSSILYFMDFKHFNGNESPFLLNDPVGSYRLLSYYNFSTQDEYVSVLGHYQFRKFLITQLPILRVTGVKELIFASYLGTPNSENYLEIGYGFDNLLRIFRLELAASFVNGAYQSFGVRVGLATSITVDDGGFQMRF